MVVRTVRQANLLKALTDRVKGVGIHARNPLAPEA